MGGYKEGRRAFVGHSITAAAGAAAGVLLAGCGRAEASLNLPKIVRLPENNFPLRYPTGERFIGEALTDVQLLISLIEKKKDNPLVNPDLSFLRWNYEVNAEYFKPPSLLKMMQILAGDLREKEWVVLEEDKNDPIELASLCNYTDLFITDNKTPNLGKTHILFNYADIRDVNYLCSGNDGRKVTISNLGLLPLLLYEYGARLQLIATVIALKKDGTFDAVRNQKENKGIMTVELARKIIEERKKKIRETGYFFSRDQNLLQLALVRSIAALAGNPEGEVIGLERHMSWKLYSDVVGLGILTCDFREIAELLDFFTVDAKY